jgi:hypothetical protein
LPERSCTETDACRYVRSNEIISTPVKQERKKEYRETIYICIYVWYCTSHSHLVLDWLPWFSSYPQLYAVYT